MGWARQLRGAHIREMARSDGARPRAEDRRGSAARRSQGYYESLMLRADRAVARLDQKYDLVKRDMKRALRPLKRTRSRRAQASHKPLR